jgi:hypothetical protein
VKLIGIHKPLDTDPFEYFYARHLLIRFTTSNKQAKKKSAVSQQK